MSIRTIQKKKKIKKTSIYFSLKNVIIVVYSGTIIGKGGYATVYSAVNNDGNVIAVKVYKHFWFHISNLKKKYHKYQTF